MSKTPKRDKVVLDEKSGMPPVTKLTKEQLEEMNRESDPDWTKK